MRTIGVCPMASRMVSQIFRPETWATGYLYPQVKCPPIISRGGLGAFSPNKRSSNRHDGLAVRPERSFGEFAKLHLFAMQKRQPTGDVEFIITVFE